MAKMLLQRRKTGGYHNWDDIEFRRVWAQHPTDLLSHHKGQNIPLIILDEIHKDRQWKRRLKGVFDTLASPRDFLVTGSAKLNEYMKGSDSLLGRHLSFRLHPFSLREMAYDDVLSPDQCIKQLFTRSQRGLPAADGLIDSLLSYGPFPEPLLSQDSRQVRLWRRNREQLIIREDLRDLSRLPELGRIEMMTAMLPDRVGSLFSLASLGRDLEVSIPTVKRWLTYLKAIYYLFEIKPYSHCIPRSLRREGKVYLWDYAQIKNEAARFENLVACHLLKTCHYWTDTGEGDFELFFLRDKQKREIDFLITRDGQPWLPVEVKLKDSTYSENWKHFSKVLSCRQGLQIVRKSTWAEHALGTTRVLVAGAAEALNYFA